MKFIVIMCFLLTSGCVSVSERDLDEKTAVIIEADEGGGGSGVVLSSSAEGSVVLTNQHVCEGVVPNATVTTSSGVRSRAVAMKVSKVHDLCLIKVNRNLRLSSKIARSEGQKGDDAVVIGHPHLLPQIKAFGKFTGFMDVTLMVGIRPCSDREREQYPLECLFMRGMPITRKFEAQAISSIVAPGNSGSPVFNVQGEVVNLVFAGKGTSLSYALTVPNGQVRAFVFDESRRLKWVSTDRLASKPSSGLKMPTVVKVERAR